MAAYESEAVLAEKAQKIFDEINGKNLTPKDRLVIPPQEMPTREPKQRATEMDEVALGYTETLLGRRRYLPELTSDSRQRRENAERVALNSPIQGSAADIIKLAMLRVDHALKKTGAASRLGIIGGNTEVVSLFAVPAVEPVVHVESVDIEPAEASIDVGLTLQLSASVSPENATEKRVSWSTSDAGIATVNENGVVYGSTAGTAVMTAASLDGGIIGTCTVTVNAAASSSDYQRVDTLESGGDYLIVTRVGGQAYALVNRNASPNNFAAMLVPVVLSADGEYVLSPLDSSESMDNLLWTANGDYTNGFSFRSVGSGLYFAGLTYCNWTAINQTEDLWLPLEHTDGGTAKTILKSVRAEQIDPTAVKLYAGITTGYFNSVIFDYVRIADAANVEFYKFGSSGSEYALGDVNMDGSVSVSDALMVLRFTMGLETLSDAQLELADFNGDGTVSTVDALDILRAAI